MADVVDIANDYLDNEISRALNKLQQNNKTKRKSGSKICVECGENMPVERYDLGFQLCVTCAAEAERRRL